MLVLTGVINSIGGKLLIYMTEFAAIWHIVRNGCMCGSYIR
jgi:hypothetical protein